MNEVKSYNTIFEEASGEIIEKKSRFIASVFHIESEEEAIAILERIKKQYWDARHNCYAYILGKGSEIKRFSDDGEPSGTAGKPILEVISGKELTNVLIVVTRYFGGVLLGTGGLVRAYTDASCECLNNAALKKMCLMKKTGVVIDYNLVGKLKYLLANEGILILDEEYTDMVSISIAIPKDENEGIIKKITDLTGGKAKFEELDEDYIALDI